MMEDGEDPQSNNFRGYTNPSVDRSPQVDKLARATSIGEQCERELHGDSINPGLSTGDNRQPQQQCNRGRAAD